MADYLEFGMVDEKALETVASLVDMLEFVWVEKKVVRWAL
jgi:hypothetical protein